MPFFGDTYYEKQIYGRVREGIVLPIEFSHCPPDPFLHFLNSGGKEKYALLYQCDLIDMRNLSHVACSLYERNKRKKARCDVPVLMVGVFSYLSGISAQRTLLPPLRRLYVLLGGEGDFLSEAMVELCSSTVSGDIVGGASSSVGAPRAGDGP